MRLLVAAVLVVLVAQAGLTTRLEAAHEKFKFVGSIAAITADEIAIKSIDGATYEMDFPDSTAIRNKSHNKVDRATLKVGEKVVVMALGHDMFDLEAVDVQLTER